MFESNRDSHVRRANDSRTQWPIAMVSALAFVSLVAACGGKVDFVTGGTGQTGANVCQQLIERGDHVRALVTPEDEG